MLGGVAGLHVKYLRAAQSLKALPQISLTLEGMDIDSNALHRTNALLPIAPTPEGIITSLRLSQLQKVVGKIDVTPEGMEKYFRAEQPLNADQPMEVTLQGVAKVTFVSEEQS